MKLTILSAVEMAVKKLGHTQSKYTKDLFIVHNIRLGDLILKYYPGDENLAIAGILLKPYNKEQELKNLKSYNKDVVNLIEEVTTVFHKKKFPLLSKRERLRLERYRLDNISERGKLLKLFDLYYTLLDIYTHDKNFAVVYAKEAVYLSQVLAGSNEELYNNLISLNKEIRNNLKT